MVREKSSIPCVATGNVGATIKRKAAKGKEVEIHGSLREYKLFTPMGSCSTVKVVCESVRRALRGKFFQKIHVIPAITTTCPISEVVGSFGHNVCI